MAAGGTNAGMNPDEQTTSLLGLLQMLQTMLAPLQNMLTTNTGANEQQGVQSMPALLLQAMNGNPGFARQLLQNPGMQAWLAQASAVLQALSQPTGQSATADLLSGLSVPSKLTAQNTLLQLATLTEQSPANPIAKHLMSELQRTVEPLLATLSAQGASGSRDSSDLLSQLASANPEIDASWTQGAVRDAGKQKQSQLPAQSGDNVMVQQVAVETFGTDQLQQTKSRLEMLAAKTSGIPSLLPQQLGGAAAADAEGSQSPSSDSSLFQSPTMQLQDLLKTLQQANFAPDSAAHATINAQTFVKDMSDFMIKNMKFSLGDAVKEAKLSLNPEHLGQIDVKITLHSSGQLVAQLMADTAAGRQLLESQLPQLRQTLQSQGLQVERLEVAQQADMASSMFQQQRQGQGGGQPFARNNRTRLPELEAVDSELASDLRTLADIRQNGGSVTDPSFDAMA